MFVETNEILQELSCTVRFRYVKISMSVWPEADAGSDFIAVEACCVGTVV